MIRSGKLLGKGFALVFIVSAIVVISMMPMLAIAISDGDYAYGLEEEPTIIWQGDVTLIKGTTFSFVPCNNASVSYDVNATTDLCALNATGLAFNASDTWYATYGSFYLESIAGIENEVWPNNTWALYINDAMASKGMGANELVDGDNVKFYFCPSDPATYAYQIENASYLVNITVIIQEVLFDGTVTLTNGTTFTFVPSNNASASYVVSTTTDLGALTATGLAFNASDEWYASYGSFWLDSIAGIENEVWPNSTWCIYINDVAASNGLSGNELKDGDNVKFYFCPANATTYAYITENATYLVNINVSVPPPPTPTPRPHHGGGGAPRDSDHDGYSDVEELLAGTNQNDPNDYPGKPAVAPTPLATPTPSTIVITPTLTPVPAPVTTPTPVPATPTPEEPGFEVVCAIAGLITVAYLVLKRKKG